MSINQLIKNRATTNTFWLIGGKMFNKVTAFLVGIITARYLGPSNYGLINYAAVYTTFFAALCTLGINSIIVKEFVDKPSEQGEILGSALAMRAVSSVMSVMMISGLSFIIDRNDKTTIVVVILCSIGMLFQIYDTINYWFLSKLQSKFTAIISSIGYFIVSVYKIGLFIFEKNVYWFALSTSVDYIVVAVLLFFAYRKNNGPKLSISFNKTKELLGKSKSFIITELMVAVYASTDRIMLKHMIDEASVGYYALIISLSQMWVFVISAIIDSMNPSIMRYHNTNKEKYVKRNKQLYAIVFYICMFVSVVIFLLADPIISILYGADYIQAIKPLKIIVWYTAFSCLGAARNAWIVCENRQKYLKYIYIGAAITNVVLNYVLIPIYGVAGAAFASLTTQIATIFIFPMLIPVLRENVKLMMEAIMLKNIF